MKDMKVTAFKAEVWFRVFVYILFALFMLAKSAFGQNWVEERTFVAGGVATERIDGLLTRPIRGKWGDFIWFQDQQGYAESYLGGTLSPKPCLQFALGAGLEEAKHPGRIGSYVWLGNKRNSVLFIAEDGGSGFWYKVEALHTFSPFLDGGFIEERFKGSGPEVKFGIPHTPFAIWGTPMIDRDPSSRHFRTNILIGVRWSL
jgi:hypothetical protein